MSRFYSHVNTAKALLAQYSGEEPFSAFLKNFFRQEKKYGGRDRRTISSICYHYFRTGFGLQDKDMDERLLAAVFLMNDVPNDWLQAERPQWNDMITTPLVEKLRFINFDPASIFPFAAELSKGVDTARFNRSFLIQPDVFLRTRPGKQTVVKSKLAAAKVDFTSLGEYCLSVANGTNVDKVIDINREAVIQDLNSQRVGEFLPPRSDAKKYQVWDCCAASGGKSIMAYDLLSPIVLTVSDVRQSIVANLVKRFKEAGINGYQHFVADVTRPSSLRPLLTNTRFDLVICDAPCSGSGTWSRTPEQLLFFKKSEIDRYSALQKSIAAATIPYLTKGGYFLYITCSVFEKENEVVVDFIKSQPGMHLVKMELLKGYELKADTLFAALFQFD